ncbi:MAG: MG2 domain-containing protein, partial [Verrucomicrobiota bacterium]
MKITKVPLDTKNLMLTGKFAPGVSYDVKVKRGLVSMDGCVMAYDATRTVVFSNPRQDDPKPAIASNNFDLKRFSKQGAGVISRGMEELTWEFSADAADAKEVGAELQDAPIEFTPKVAGKFRWKSAKDLVFTPATGWELNQFYSARLVRDLKSPTGAVYAGSRFWAFSTPAFGLASVVQTGNPGGNQFRLFFNSEPDIDSLRKTLKVYSLAEDGQRLFTDCVITPGATSSMMIASLATPTTGTVYFEISPGLRRVDWELGTTAPMMKETNRSSVLSVREIRDNGANAGVLGIHVTFSEEVNVKDLAAFIEITPNVKFSVQKVSGPNNQLFISGGFKAESQYQVKIRPGLVSKNGDVLANESKTTVNFPRLRASLSFDADGRYLSPEGTMLIPLKSVNLKECRISVAPVLVNNLVAFARDDHQNRSYGIQDGDSSDRGGYDYEDYEGGYGRRTNIEDMIGNVTGKDIKLSSSPNTEATTYLNLRDFAGQKGAFVLQAKSRDKAEARSYDQVRSDSHLVVVTDLGITAKSSQTSVFMWVCSLKNAKPAAGVEVTAFSRNNQLIAKGVTNADGVASLACDTRDKNKNPFLVTAQLGEDLSYLRLDGNALDADQTESVRDYRSGGCEAFLFTDRGIFRPGETIHAKTIIRNNDFTVPASFPVVFQIIKPDGHLYKEFPATPNSFGIAEIEAVMPEYLPTGRYSLNLRIPRATENLGKTGFLLEDFVPPQIRVKATIEDERVEQGESIDADIFAEHLFGSPAAGLKANVKCILSLTSFTHKKWGDFVFGEQNQRDYYAGDKPSFTLKPIDVENLVLNAEGKATATIETACCLKAPGPVHALVQATVFEPGGRAITASATTTIDPYPFYIGVKRSAESYVRTGDKQKLQVITVLPTGEARTEGKPLLVKVAQVNWNYTYKRLPDGTYGYRSYKEETPIKEDTLAFSATPADYVYVPQTSGYHQITFTDPDTGSTASVSFYACDWGQSWTSSQKDRPDSLTLKLDKDEYSANDKAKLTIQSPFAGTALLTIESDRVLESRYVVLEKNTAEIDLDIKASFAPNVHCTVSVIRPAVAESTWTGHRAFGSIPLRIIPANHRMNVAVDVPATILPQSTLKAKVSLKDDAGQPADGEVTLVAVDEAICMLTSFKTPSPLAWLYEIRRLGVTSHDVYSELMRVLDESVLSGDSHISGDGDGDGNADAAELLTRRLNPIKANRFKPVSLWVSKVMVKNGVGEVDV